MQTSCYDIPLSWLASRSYIFRPVGVEDAASLQMGSAFQNGFRGVLAWVTVHQFD